MGSRGATVVEYALIVAVMVAASVVAIQFLTDQGSAEVASEADCVSTRPPPESCIAAAVTTSTTVDPVSTVTTEAPTTTTSTSTTTTAPPSSSSSTSSTTQATSTTTSTAPPNSYPGTGSFTGSDTNGYYGWGGLYAWSASADLYIKDANGNAVGGVAVEVRWTVVNPARSDSGQATCTTSGGGRWGNNNRGRCTVNIPGGWQGLDPSWATIRLEIVTIDGKAAPAGTPTLDLDRPRQW
jgi:hypothetical protein